MPFKYCINNKKDKSNNQILLCSSPIVPATQKVFEQIDCGVKSNLISMSSTSRNTELNKMTLTFSPMRGSIFQGQAAKGQDGNDHHG